MSIYKVFIQARMNSSRFPGKVLAPLGGKPIITHLVERVASVFDRDNIVVLTSIQQSDDPLYYYLKATGVEVFRGELENTFNRFRDALLKYQCDAFFRICADSPLLDTSLITRMSEIYGKQQPDLVTNVFPRTFPKGSSLELVDSAVFADVDQSCLTTEDREHVTTCFYRHHHNYRIENIECDDEQKKSENWAVDTIDDMKNVEQYLNKLTCS